MAAGFFWVWQEDFPDREADPDEVGSNREAAARNRTLRAWWVKVGQPWVRNEADCPHGLSPGLLP